jgi:hypothetical protein
MRQKRSRRPAAGRIAVLLLLIVGAAALAWYFLLRPQSASQPAAASTAAGEAGVSPPSALGAAAPMELPAVDTSDEFVRRLVGRLSAHPQFARWLVTDELVRRFVGTVADLARGASPAPHVGFMRPEDPFRVRESLGDLVIDPTGYRRYDAIATTFESLDTEGTAELIRTLRPLFVEAHRELGLPSGRTFDGDLRRAIANVLAVQVPERPPVVVRSEEGWVYADPALEDGPAAAKHLLRMGAAHAGRIQAKLAALAAALDMMPEEPTG